MEETVWATLTLVIGFFSLRGLSWFLERADRKRRDRRHRLHHIAELEYELGLTAQKPPLDDWSYR